MNYTKYIKSGLFALALAATTSLSSCDKAIEVGNKVDQGGYEAVDRVDGMLLDRSSNQNETVIEMFKQEHTIDLYFALTRKPGQGVDVVVKYDAAYLAVYNKIHNTDFELYPENLVTFDRNGELLLAPDETASVNMGVTLKASKEMDPDATYVVPVAAVSVTPGITLSEQASHAVLLVKNRTHESDTFKGEGAVKTVLYFEVNDTNPLNALEFALKDSGKLLFDEIVLFSANINYNAETGRVYVYNNPNVQFLLDNNEQYLQPLRKRGMKVILGILGNHDDAGCAQLSKIGAEQFAQELASYCKAYNLDGVGFDDEYSNYSPDLTNPLFAQPSRNAAARLLYESKRAMPDKTVMVYYLGYIYETIPAVDGVSPNRFVDYAVADYGGAAAPMKGMTIKNCAGMSIELARGRGDSSESTARNKKNQGYGYYMFFALDPIKYSTQLSRVASVCKGLYEQELAPVEYYYKKNDATRYKL